VQFLRIVECGIALTEYASMHILAAESLGEGAGRKA
jgi:hypothetical protein